jgi:hypothetical protein
VLDALLALESDMTTSRKARLDCFELHRKALRACAKAHMGRVGIVNQRIDQVRVVQLVP